METLPCVFSQGAGLLVCVCACAQALSSNQPLNGEPPFIKSVPPKLREALSSALREKDPKVPWRVPIEFGGICHPESPLVWVSSQIRKGAGCALCWAMRGAPLFCPSPSGYFLVSFSLEPRKITGFAPADPALTCDAPCCSRAPCHPLRAGAPGGPASLDTGAEGIPWARDPVGCS